MYENCSSAAASACTHPELELEPPRRERAQCLALVLVWSAREPERAGEVALLHSDCPCWILGRFPSAPPQSFATASGSDEQPLPFFRQRPLGLNGTDDSAVARAELAGEAISRRQLAIHPQADFLLVRNIGQCELSVNGTAVREAKVRPGDTLFLGGQILLYCTYRPVCMPALRAYPGDRAGPFGLPDRDGIVGESPASWKLRERLAAVARTRCHVLIVGDSGSGKELAAQAIHRLSERAEKELIADNIAAIPSGLAAALLFGNKKNFPNPGMDEYMGLIGAAHQSTLFLDEIGDMPESVQPMFLRVTERHGEYYRLGEGGRPRHSDFRLVGATNRPEQLRHELKRRFVREVLVPGLNERKEDIPLLIRHILTEQAAREDREAARFLHQGRPRLHPRLLEQLLHHTYKTHVSEVAFLLGKAMAESEDDLLRPLGPGLRPALPVPSSDAAAAPSSKRTKARALPPPSRAQLALFDSGGDITRTAALLDISRDQLNRMIRREGLLLPRARGSASKQRYEPQEHSESRFDLAMIRRSTV